MSYPDTLILKSRTQHRLLSEQKDRKGDRLMTVIQFSVPGAPQGKGRHRLAALRATIEADAAEQASRAAQAAERARRLHRQRLAQCQEQLSRLKSQTGQEMAS